MTARVLPREDYHRLAGTELETLAPYLPEDAQVLVVEDDAGQIIGCWSVYRLVHVEGVWIAPEHRKKSGVARRLITGMRQIARGMGARAVNTASASAEVTNLLRHLGAHQIEGEHFSLKVGL